MGEKAVRVVLADDHTLVRQGLKRIIEEDREYEIVGEASDGEEAIKLVKELRPHVLILDLSMPGVPGFEVMESLKDEINKKDDINKKDGIKLIVLTMHNHEAYLRRSLAAGVSGYLLKDSADVELLNALKKVMAGNTYISSSAALLIKDDDPDRIIAEGNYKDYIISKREREVLRLIIEGNTSREIGEILYISPRTVEHHRAKIMEKLGTRKLVDLIKIALEEGIT